MEAASLALSLSNLCDLRTAKCEGQSGSPELRNLTNDRHYTNDGDLEAAIRPSPVSLSLSSRSPISIKLHAFTDSRTHISRADTLSSVILSPSASGTTPANSSSVNGR
nr:hypothetical protein Iba_scaffold14838CG0070 [Ipomoea batatas]GME13911.1 hypothetical protein Iba_scaffold14838CG0080 [Ipomoea batatas]